MIAGTSVVLLGVATGVTAAVFAVPTLEVVLIAIAAAYIVWLAHRIATAPPLADKSPAAGAPSVAGAMLLAIANQKAWVAIAAVFTTARLADNASTDAVAKTAVLSLMIVVIMVGWLLAGARWRHCCVTPSARLVFAPCSLGTRLVAHPETRSRTAARSAFAVVRAAADQRRLTTSRDVRKPFAEKAGRVPKLPSGTITFLFTDIEGSTRLLKQLGDRYADVLAAHNHSLREAFANHGGEVVDTQGDAFFVAFPRARDAIEAAVAAQRMLAAQRWPDAIELRVRMGIHTGEPTVGADRYVGLGVHRAARISSIGHGGQVLLSDATRALVEDELPPGVGLRDLGEHRLKDLDRPERVFQLVVEGLPHQFPPLKAEVRAGAPLVGRYRELAELEASLEEALAGRGSVVLVAGEPGIGKSRLADELAGRSAERGARVLWGRCWEAGGAPAYWPWVQSIRSYVRETEPEKLRTELGAGAATIAQMLPDLRTLFPDLPEPPLVETEEARFRLFDATAAMLRTTASRRPVVLVLEDVHAADVPSLLLLQFLAGELRGAPLLILGTYRDVDLGHDHPLRRTLAELARAPGTRTLSLGGLSEAEVAQLIETVTGRSPRDASCAPSTPRRRATPSSSPRWCASSSPRGCWMRLEKAPHGGSCFRTASAR